MATRRIFAVRVRRQALPDWLSLPSGEIPCILTKNGDKCTDNTTGNT